MSSTVKSEKHANYFQAIVPGVSQKLTFTGTSQQSAAFQDTTTIIRVFVTQDAWVVTGSNPTAAADDGSSMFLPGGTWEYIGVEPGDKIAVILDSVGGDMHITEGL